MTRLPTIAAKLSASLRHMPCTCVTVGSWPLFKEDTKAHKPKTCARCLALAEYDAYRSIVQLPAIPAKEKP